MKALERKHQIPNHSRTDSFLFVYNRSPPFSTAPVAFIKVGVLRSLHSHGDSLPEPEFSSIGVERQQEHSSEPSERAVLSSVKPVDSTSPERSTWEEKRSLVGTTERFTAGSEGSLPSWAGAFGAVPEMEDSHDARGFYVRRFCEVFFPDNPAGAMEVSSTLSITTYEIAFKS